MGAATSGRSQMNRPSGGPWLAAVVLTLLIAGTSLVACQPFATGAATAHLTGVVYMRGSVTSPTRVEAKVTATRKSGAGRSYSTDTASDGSFTFDLPPGKYELTATLTAKNPGSVATPEDATLHKGETTSIDLYVNFP